MITVTILSLILVFGICFALCLSYFLYKHCKAHIAKKKLQESRKNWKLKHRNTLTGNFVMTYHMAVDEMYQFKDQSLLGKGSYGVVVIGIHKETKVEYAIKLVNTETGKRHRIEREYKLLKDIDHPNIVRLFAVYDTPREVSFVMELCTGGHLGNLMDRTVLGGGVTIPEAQAKTIVRQLLSAVAHMHGRGICHRDIKLQNIMLESNQSGAQVKLIDFGLGTRFIGATPMKTRCGTLYSTAPEVLRESYDEKCDIWSCGVITFILLSGRKPFEALVLYPASGEDHDGKCSVMTNILMNRLHYKQKNWKKTSSEGLEFTQEMLQHNYKIRWSALEALEHRWLKECQSSEYDFTNIKQISTYDEEVCTQALDAETHANGNGPNSEYAVFRPRKFSSGSIMSESSIGEPNLVQVALKNMKKQVDSSVLHQTSMLAVAYNMPHSQAANRRAFFQTYDADKNGVLSREEFRKAMQACNIFTNQTTDIEPLSEEDIDRIFIAVDVNGDGQISFTEFLAATLDPRDYDIHALNTAFQLLDVDQKGYITAADMERVLSVTSSARKRSIMTQHSQTSLHNLLNPQNNMSGKSIRHVPSQEGIGRQPSNGERANSNDEDDLSQCSKSDDGKPPPTLAQQGRQRSASLGNVARRSSMFKDIIPIMTAPRRSSTSKIMPAPVSNSLSGEDEFSNSDLKKKKKSISNIQILSHKSGSGKTAPYILPDLDPVIAEQINRAIKLVDRNGTGVVSYSDFLLALTEGRDDRPISAKSEAPSPITYPQDIEPITRSRVNSGDQEIALPRPHQSYRLAGVNEHISAESKS